MTISIPFPRSEGIVTKQAHADLPPNSFEREIGADGFAGPSAHFYHRRAPTAWESIEGEVRPRALDLRTMTGTARSPFDAVPIASSRTMKLRLWRASADMDHLVRNADGDDLLFVHEGEGALFCDYGRLEFSEGDYIVMPRGTMWRVALAKPATLLLLEATGQRFRLPDRGLLGQHALFDAGVLRIPSIDQAFVAQQDMRAWEVSIKRHDALSRIRYGHNPLDAIGWKGTLMPVALNWRDIRPVMSHRFHLPPSAHTTFEADGLVVATFVPRPIESDAGALKVPFFHSNDDYDELVFFHRGQFFSRDDFGPGMMTFHPSGFPHGPHPKAFQTGQQALRTETDEVAINIDCKEPVTLASFPEGIERADYARSWAGFLAEA